MPTISAQLNVNSTGSRCFFLLDQISSRYVWKHLITFGWCEWMCVCVCHKIAWVIYIRIWWIKLSRWADGIARGWHIWAPQPHDTGTKKSHPLPAFECSQQEVLSGLISVKITVHCNAWRAVHPLPVAARIGAKNVSTVGAERSNESPSKTTNWIRSSARPNTVRSTTNTGRHLKSRRRLESKASTSQMWLRGSAHSDVCVRGNICVEWSINSRSVHVQLELARDSPWNRTEALRENGTTNTPTSESAPTQTVGDLRNHQYQPIQFAFYGYTHSWRQWCLRFATDFSIRF